MRAQRTHEPCEYADCLLMGLERAKEQVQTCAAVASGRALSRVSQHQGRAAKHCQPLHCQFIWLQLVDNIYRPAGAMLGLCMQIGHLCHDVQHDQQWQAIQRADGDI